MQPRSRWSIVYAPLLPGRSITPVRLSETAPPTVVSPSIVHQMRVMRHEAPAHHPSRRRSTTHVQPAQAYTTKNDILTVLRIVSIHTAIPPLTQNQHQFRQLRITQKRCDCRRVRSSHPTPAERYRYFLPSSQKHRIGGEFHVLSGSFAGPEIDGSLARDVRREHDHCMQ